MPRNPMPATFNTLSRLRFIDRRRLLMADDDQLIGLVIQLNRSPRYSNGLDALRLAFLIMQRRSRRGSRA